LQVHISRLLLIFTACAISARGIEIQFQTSTNEMRDLAPLLKPHLQRTKFPALTAAIIKGTNITAAGAVGLRKAGENEPVTLPDKFHIGSCTKSMTALLAVFLAHEGKIQLTNRVGDLLHDWKIPENVASITLQQLLQNISGIGNDPDPKALERASMNFSVPPPLQRRRFLEEVLQARLAAKPGRKFIYSNVGYALAGAMLERAVGKSWEDLMRDEILEPIELDSAGFGPPSISGAVDQPWGHEWNDQKPSAVPPSDNPVAIAPGGAVHLAILDCARYAAFHLAVAQGKIDSLKPYRGVLYSPPKDSPYALGWMIEDRLWAGGNALTHAGSNTMFSTVIWIAPEKNFACVISTNVGDREDYVTKQCDAIVADLVEKFVR
jgi:CubicO group peptidase (beta-lactamase class C family)